MKCHSTLQGAIILIASDSWEDAQVISAILAKGGYAVRCVNSSSSLFAVVKFSPPNLIVLDTTLLNVDACYICERLKTDEITRNIPVLFFPELCHLFYNSSDAKIGSFNCIAKPFLADEVLARVESQLTIQPDPTVQK